MRTKFFVIILTVLTWQLHHPIPAFSETIRKEFFVTEDTIIRFKSADASLVAGIGKKYLNCIIELDDSTDHILGRYFYLNGEETYRILYEYYTNLPVRLYSMNIYSRANRMESRSFISEDTSSYQVTLFFENGKTHEEGNIKKGLKDGTWEAYFPSGKIHSSCKYSNGLKNGKYREYFENGKTKLSAEYETDTLNGKYTEYDLAGNTVKQDEYKNGDLIVPVYKPTKEEIVQAKMDEFGLKESDLRGCVYIIKTEKNKMKKEITIGDGVSVIKTDGHEKTGTLKAIKGNHIYLSITNAFGKEKDIVRILISNIAQFGYGGMSGGTYTPNMGFVGGGTNYKMFSIDDKKFKIVFDENCSEPSK